MKTTIIEIISEETGVSQEVCERVLLALEKVVRNNEDKNSGFSAIDGTITGFLKKNSLSNY